MSVPLSTASPTGEACFDDVLERHGFPPLRREAVTTLQVNVGRRCNQACVHCHVDAGPNRSEFMPATVIDRVLTVLAASPGVTSLDITGGAPELCPDFRRLVASARGLGRRVLDRCNLTVLFEPGQEDLASFLARHQVAVVASLPCFLGENVDRQRGHGVFERSLLALVRLNTLGYGLPGSPLELDLVFNPQGAGLPPDQTALEATYRQELKARHGIEFHRLLTITNMPIARFADDLRRRGEHRAYMDLLVRSFNPSTVSGLMCRSLVSVGWDGGLADCDFHQVLGLRSVTSPGTIFEVDALDELAGTAITTAGHCFGCTAGPGSSCGGALT